MADNSLIQRYTCISEVNATSCFSFLTADDNLMLDNNTVTITYKKGETICKQGSFASNIIFLEKGLVKIYLEGNPKNLILTITPSGHIIGVPSIFEGNNTFFIR